MSGQELLHDPWQKTMRQTCYPVRNDAPSNFPYSWHSLRGISVIVIPPDRPLQSGSHSCCFVTKLSLSFGATDIHVMAGHAHTLQRNEWRGHTTLSIT